MSAQKGAGAAYTINGQLVPRERFYTVACDPARSVVVEACAGAGKTWMLVSRILRALLEGAEPQQVVAITFTRKAAGEMRQRLSEWLGEFARAGETERVEALVARGMSEPDARHHAPALATLQQRLLQQGRSVEIRTFHAWFSQLLRAAPMELLQSQGLSPELQLLEDEEDLMPEVWRRFHERVLGDEALHQDYQSLVDDCSRGTVQKWLSAGFDKRVELRLAQAQGRLMDSVEGPESLSPRFGAGQNPLALLEPLREPLQALARLLGQGKNKTMLGKAVELEKALSDEPDPGAAFRAIYKALLTDSGTPRKALGESPELMLMVDELLLIQRGLDQQEAQQLHQRLARLSLCLIEGFDALKRERGLVDMNDLERGALALLGDAALAGWVQERLDAQLRHLLIDEFQDTSPLQWQALHAWLSGYGGAGGGASGQRPPSVFIVGDPKQSIYRFRRAEPRVFAAAQDFVRSALDGALLACDHTRRNAPAVLDAVNAVLLEAQRLEQYAGFRAHTTESGGVDALQGVLRIDAADDAAGDDEPVRARAVDQWRPSLLEARHEPELHRRAAEAARIGEAIAGLISESQVLPGEIFVLARKRDALRVLAEALKARNIAHAAPEEAALLDAPDVRDLLALLDVLASPEHGLSLAHVLRSPLIDATEQDLLWLAEQSGSGRWLGREESSAAQPREARRSWWQVLMDAQQVLPGEALARARRLLGEWASQLHRRTPHELLDLIVHQGELLSRIAALAPPTERRARLHAVQSLLALSLDLDGGRYATVYAFVRALRRRALSLSLSAEPDAVQLLTVHGAKGLEARVVFLMDTDTAPARAESATLLIDWPVDQAWPDRVAFLGSESRPPPALAELMDFEQAQRRREELNGLYVAMTRARSRLVISRSLSVRGGGSGSWWNRLSGHAAPWVLEAVASGEADSSASTQTSLRVLPLAPPPDALDEPPDLVVRTEALDESAALGEALHRVLEWRSGPLGRDTPLETLLGAAAQMYGLDARRSERLQRSAEAILGSSECAPFFDEEQLLWAGNEVPLSHQGQDLRIDRLVQRRDASGEACWWVLDYKLHAQPQQQPEYIAQLARYREAVSLLQSGERVRTAFITGQGRLVEVE